MMSNSYHHEQECYQLARIKYDALPYNKKTGTAYCPQCGAMWICTHPRLDMWEVREQDCCIALKRDFTLCGARATHRYEAFGNSLPLCERHAKVAALLVEDCIGILKVKEV